MVVRMQQETDYPLPLSNVIGCGREPGILNLRRYKKLITNHAQTPL